MEPTGKSRAFFSINLNLITLIPRVNWTMEHGTPMSEF